MATLLLAAAGYAVYKQQQEKGPTREFKDYELDPAVLHFLKTSKNIESVRFLPFELTVGHLHNSLTTITFYEGNYLNIKTKLERRINEVLKVNPWLGGRLVVKPGEDDLKLWYDPECIDIPPNIYTCHDPGVIPLKRSTKYGQYRNYLPDYSIVVPCVKGLVGSNHPVFKVAIVPDVVEHNERFAIIVSQSHMIGDAHTYYKIFHMMFNSKNENTKCGMINTAPVEQMNPIRRADVNYHIEKHMGFQEASYVLKTNSNMVDEIYDKVTCQIEGNIANQEKKTMLFTVSERWLKAKTKECIAAKRKKNSLEKKKEYEKIEDYDKYQEGQNTSDCDYNAELSEPHHGEASVAMFRNQPSGSMVSNNTSSSSSSSSSHSVTEATRSLSSSFVNDDGNGDEIHPTDVLLSWWFNISDADIGLIPHHLRKELNVLSELDAGNYNTPIPYTKADYETPYQIHESIKEGKRSKHFENPLPRITTGYTFAMGIDWDKLYSGRFWNNNSNYEKSKDESINENDSVSEKNDIVDDGIKKDLHVPLLTDLEISVMPAKMNLCLLFTAKSGRQRRQDRDDDDDIKNDGNFENSMNDNDESEEARIGVLIVATEDICDKVVECGIIDDDMKSSKTAQLTSNRRNTYIDFESLSLELVLNEDEDEDEEDVAIVGFDNQNEKTSKGE